MTADRKKIYLLIGPKGSGKSFIGTLFQQHYGIPFLRVEDWAKNVKRDRDVLDATYIAEVFHVIERGVRQAMHDHAAVVFESTGVSDAFDAMLASLRKDFRVVVIRIDTDPDVCLERVRTRDASIHIAVSDHEVARINAVVLQKALPVDVCMTNTSRTREDLIREIGDIVTQS